VAAVLTGRGSIGAKISVVRRIRVIGIGAGDPEFVTVQAIRALNDVDVFFLVDKGEEKSDLLQLRNAICTRYIEHDRYRTVSITDPPRDLSGPDYGEAVRGWHLERVAQWGRIMLAELAEGQVGAFLSWGDPTIYDSTLRILEEVGSRGEMAFELDVIPGISAPQVLAARHQIPLTRVGGSIVITSGRQLAETWHGGASDVVVMLDANCAFLELGDPTATIYWGAHLGTDDEVLIAGTVGEVGAEIVQARADARLKKGWVFDTYLLRRAP
jgi:precorrin-6A synthase